MIELGTASGVVSFPADLRDGAFGQLRQSALIQHGEGLQSNLGSAIEMDGHAVETASAEKRECLAVEDERAPDEAAVVESSTVDDDALAGKSGVAGVSIQHEDKPALSFLAESSRRLGREVAEAGRQIAARGGRSVFEGVFGG